MSKPILALIPSGYKSGKVYSILPNDASGDFDYERNGNATRVRKDGLIEELTVDDTPRLDWLNSDCPSLKLEPQRTNLQVYSEQFDNSAWTKSLTTVYPNEILAPNGKLASDKLECNTTGGSMHVRDNFTITSGSTVTFSVYAKKGNARYCNIAILTTTFAEFSRVFFDLQEGTVFSPSQSGSNVAYTDYDIQNVGNDWYRLSLTCDTTGQTTLVSMVYGTTGNGTFGVTQGDYNYFWGAQVEQGDYASSYIKTEASTVTRLKDECINGGDSNLFDITEGTFFVDTTPFIYEATERITLSDNSYNNRITISKSSATQIQFIIVSNNVTQVNIIINFNYSQRNKIAITFKQNEFKFYINGTLEGTDTSGIVPIGLNDLSFKGIGSALYWNGKIHDTRVYDRVLTEAEAIELTT